MANLFIAYELDVWSRDLNTKMIVCVGATKLIKNANFNKYGWSSYGIGFYASSHFLPNGE